MERDLNLFPEDEHGDALWSMLQQGDDLSVSREFQFSIIFANEEQALKYGQLLLENNQKLSFCPYPDNENLPWEITAYPEMPATYENVTAYQQLLEQSSAPLGGHFDGWFCHSMKS
ncbi:ribonuclease E inhibitor RraB [Thalassotalea marina]|uniref:Regulator of ribonuclease activity B domain-containing protein n=1 Tax=Thalassotalea marina TaxID=1673741 RepID=A0A919ELI1_9GAMM|nr:ribonuclease E inhibitor RraB [Thalassotalea marina]GHF96287.1 hypothetical protein GCM10017161_25800 [Thalassotalea marina]